MARNTRALRASAYQEVLNQRDALMIPLVQSGEIADLATRGLTGRESLSEVERVRFNIWFVTVMSNLENIHYQHRVGLLEEDRWRTHLSRLRTFVISPGFAEWWSRGEFGFLQFRRGPSSPPNSIFPCVIPLRCMFRPNPLVERFPEPSPTKVLRAPVVCTNNAPLREIFPVASSMRSRSMVAVLSCTTKPSLASSVTVTSSARAGATSPDPALGIEGNRPN